MSERAWLVVRLGWYYDEYIVGWERALEFEQGGTAERGFADPEAARVWRDELERRARRELCPFRFVNLDFSDQVDGSSRSVDEFRRLLNGYGVDTPCPVSGLMAQDEWLLWWDTVAPMLSPQQREDIWRLFDTLHLYTVVEVELED